MRIFIWATALITSRIIFAAPSTGTCSQLLSETTTTERWTVDGGSSDYDRDFDLALEKAGTKPSEAYFKDLVAERRKNSAGTNMVDLMGSGLALPYDLADSVTGLRLKHLKLEDGDLIPGASMPTQVIGNVLDLQTWQDLDSSLRSRGVKRVDLFVMRPMGGWDKIGSNSNSHVEAVTKICKLAFERLSENGHIYIALNHNRSISLYESADFQAFIDEARKNNPPFEVILSHRYPTEIQNLLMKELFPESIVDPTHAIRTEIFIRPLIK